jgi:hypothetical protein
VYDSNPHSTGEYRATKQHAFEYFRNFEEYPVRYSKYCKWVRVVSRSDNSITTKEFWNITLDKNMDHVVLDVRYELIPNTAISYEILGRYASGIKNRISFLDLKDNTDRIIIELALPILDTPGHPYAKNSFVYQDLWFYLRMQNAEFLENTPFTKFAVGQNCINCKEGKLIINRPGNSTEIDNYKLVGEQFECDLCHHRHYNNYIFSRDGVDVTNKTTRV